MRTKLIKGVSKPFEIIEDDNNDKQAVKQTKPKNFHRYNFHLDKLANATKESLEDNKA